MIAWSVELDDPKGSRPHRHPIGELADGVEPTPEAVAEAALSCARKMLREDPRLSAQISGRDPSARLVREQASLWGSVYWREHGEEQELGRAFTQAEHDAVFAAAA